MFLCLVTVFAGRWRWANCRLGVLPVQFSTWTPSKWAGATP